MYLVKHVLKTTPVAKALFEFLFFYFLINLFIYFWPRGVFVAARGFL